MQKFTQDYTLIQEAMDSLYSATRFHANECYHDALDRINEARTLLTQYLSQDNMVPDDDVQDGWVKCRDAFSDKELYFIRDSIAEKIESIYIRPSVAAEALAIINHCQSILSCPEFDSVEQFLDNKSNTWTEIKIHKEVTN